MPKTTIRSNNNNDDDDDDGGGVQSNVFEVSHATHKVKIYLCEMNSLWIWVAVHVNIHNAKHLMASPDECLSTQKNRIRKIFECPS